MDQAGTNLMIRQALARHQAALDGWVRQVRFARTAGEAFRAAARQPIPPSLIASLRVLHGNPGRRARAEVEAALAGWVEKLPADDPHLPELMRAVRGHFPEIHRKLEALRR
ncbi:hypothetical protein EV663_105138 [Rhodovulum bhavnagarense]|uniref:Uncharacterized protein n=1 Tax=Rhodovulum bhavnagarense TaxID=992286 RepID=A0A4R2RDA0_9RHOB|nr:hypothetical protein [Rhodovulum bhavnagarense]TCP61420.1 hypothetical protein EV663_105138 [Rhodovulum bhavnagarense]